MSYDDVGQLANGVSNLAVNNENAAQSATAAHSKKKRTARAYHNLQPEQPPLPLGDHSLNGQFGAAPQFPGAPVGQGIGISPYQPQVPGPANGAPLQSGFNTPQINGVQPQFQAVSPQEQFQNYPQSYPSQNQVPQQSHTTTINLSNSSVADNLSVPYARQAAQEEWQFQSFKSFQNNLPPTATTKYSAYDQGCSTPKFSTLSMYQIPETEALRNSTKLPLGLTIRPFAPLDANEEPIPEVQMDSFDGPIRCRRCRTYINPMMTFTHDQKFICNICHCPNAVPHEYAAPLDVNGRRVDYLQRPELHKGTIDFIVPEPYWQEKTAPDTLHQIFLIDVSASNEIIESTVQAVREVIEGLNNGTKVAIITYDERIHLFDLGSETLNIYTISDLDDPFIPIDKGLFVDPQENSIQISGALSRISDLYKSLKTPAVAYGAALKCSLLALEKYGGGKITATLSKIPSWGAGGLANTDNKSRGSEDFKTNNQYYLKLSDEFVTKNVGLDLFVISNSSVDLINSASPVFATGGTLKLYNNYSVQKDELQFTQDFYQSVVNATGYQGQLKTRCSSGLQIESYYGNFLNPGSNDPKLPILSSDQEFSVLFKYDSKLDPKQDVHFQTALLYTGVDGVRRVRVINSIASITKDASSVFAFADQDVVLNIIIKNCLKFVTKQNPIEIKNSTTSKIIEIFTQYRALVANIHSRQSQLILPDGLTTLTAYISSFQKSKIFKTSTPNNLKIYDYYQLNSLPLEKLLLHLYPRITALHELRENDGMPDPTTGIFTAPQDIRASSQYVQEGGAYLIFNGESLVLWIHSRVNPLLLEDLFGVSSIEQLNPDWTEFPPLSTTISQQARNIVEHYQGLLKRYLLPFKLLRQGLDAVEFQFGDFLVEDRAIDKTESYTELIGVVHRRIKENLEKDKVIKNSDATHEDNTLSQRFIQF